MNDIPEMLIGFGSFFCFIGFLIQMVIFWVGAGAFAKTWWGMVVILLVAGFVKLKGQQV